MKKIIFLLSFFFFVSSSNSQILTPGNHIFVFKTYEDFVNNKSEDLGQVTSYGSLNVFVLENLEKNKQKKFKLNDYWGYKIGNYTFRIFKKEGVTVSFIRNDFGLSLYIDGAFTMRKAVWGIDFFNSTTHENDGYFYSDSLNSEIFEISKIVKYKNPSAEMIPLIECIKEANERYGVQAKFNGQGKCIFPNSK